jgi:hypothetical protein
MLRLFVDFKRYLKKDLFCFEGEGIDFLGWNDIYGFGG